MASVSELVLSAETIVYGFAIARLLHGAQKIFTSPKSSFTVKLIWVTCCVHVSSAIWSSTNLFVIDKLDFIDFNIRLIFAGISYFMCDSLAPHNSENIESFHDHFFEIRIRYWVCNLLMALNGIAQIEYTAKYNILPEMYNLFYSVVIIPWILIIILGLYAKSEKLQLLAAALHLIYYIFNGIGTMLNSASITN